MRPETELEMKVWRLVGAIEETWKREEHRDVYNSLVAILDAQHNSLQLQGSQALDLSSLFSLCFSKGGTSVMADMYLNLGSASDEQAAFGFNFGVALQLLDDIQDVRRDLFDGQQTVCTHFYTHSPVDLEKLVAKLLNFLTIIIEPSDLVENKTVGVDQLVENKAVGVVENGKGVESGKEEVERSLRKAMLNMCYSIVLKAVSKDLHLFSPAFVSQIESFCPIPFDSMKRVVLVKKLMHLIRLKQI